jgi:hypothetical protein
MRRRNFIASVAAAAISRPFQSAARSADSPARVGYIGTNRDARLGAAIYQDRSSWQS